MSRIGKKEISVPKGVEVKQDGNAVLVKGPKGSLKPPIVSGISVSPEHNVAGFEPRFRCRLTLSCESGWPGASFPHSSMR